MIKELLEGKKAREIFEDETLTPEEDTLIASIGDDGKNRRIEPNTPEWNALMKLSTREYDDYVRLMDNTGVKIKFDTNTDTFKVIIKKKGADND